MPEATTHHLRRDLGSMHGVGIVIGAIIGVGIFITPSNVATIAGSPEQALLMWVIGGLLALTGSLCMAEIGARFPVSGGEIVALKELLGPLPAFLFGWSLLTAINTGALVIISLFAAQNLGVALGYEWDQTQVTIAASAAIAGLAVLNLLGVKNSAWMQTSTSAVKLIILGSLALLGLYALFFSPDSTSALTESAPPSPTDPTGSPNAESNGHGASSSAPWIAGLAATIFSYGGYHQLTWLGGEVKDPQRTLPRAIVVGILLVIGGYMAANWAYFSLLPFEQVATSPTIAADAIGTFFPIAGTTITATALCISAFGIANSQVLTTPRVYYALAKQGLFPKVLGNLGGDADVPRPAILLQATLAILLLWIGGGEGMDKLVTGVVFIDVTFHVLAVGGLFLARRKLADSAFMTPMWPLTPLVFIIGTTIAMLATFWNPEVRQASIFGVVWIAVGVVVYRFTQART